MNDKVKVALIIAVAAVICVALYMYFSPYQTCMRQVDSAVVCARNMSGQH